MENTHPRYFHSSPFYGGVRDAAADPCAGERGYHRSTAGGDVHPTYALAWPGEQQESKPMPFETVTPTPRHRLRLPESSSRCWFLMMQMPGHLNQNVLIFQFLQRRGSPVPAQIQAGYSAESRSTLSLPFLCCDGKSTGTEITREIPMSMA
jgi:hypothetical protein